MIAFGDMPNDLPLLEWAGTSYAMANAHPTVLALADHVAPANDEDGVAAVLAEVFDLLARVARMSRAARPLPRLLLACLGLVLVVDAPAFACTCQPADVERRPARADAVFIGTVDGVTEGTTTPTRSPPPGPTRAPRAHHEVDSLANTAAAASANPRSARLPLPRHGHEAPYVADTCGGTGTANADRVTQIERILGRGRRSYRRPRRTATFTLVEESAPPASLAWLHPARRPR